MAARTWLGATLPEEQAEPEEIAIPARSRAISRVSAGTPGTAKQSVCGSRWTPAEKTTAFGPAIAASRSRHAVHCGARDVS